MTGIGLCGAQPLSGRHFTVGSESRGFLAVRHQSWIGGSDSMTAESTIERVKQTKSADDIEHLAGSDCAGKGARRRYI